VSASPGARSVPFRYFHHLLTVPVVVDGSRESRFVLDTGIGLNLVSQALAAEVGCEPTGETYRGKRMSSQEVEVPLARLGSLRFAGVEAKDVEVGIFDFGALGDGVEGFLSLTFFAGAPFTVDYGGGTVVVEDEASLAARHGRGTAVQVRIEDDGHALGVHLPLTVPGHSSLEVEVDTGSDTLILDERLAAAAGIALEGDGMRRVDGEDETGHAYTRVFTRLPGTIHPSGAPALAQHDPDVMVQRIIYDGLVGDAFLRRFAVTYDLPRAEMVFELQD
jgi:Aspartyl protease